MWAPLPALHFSTASLQASFCLSTLSLEISNSISFLWARAAPRRVRVCRPKPSPTHKRDIWFANMFLLCCCFLRPLEDALTPKFSYTTLLYCNTLNSRVVSPSRFEFVSLLASQIERWIKYYYPSLVRPLSDHSDNIRNINNALANLYRIIRVPPSRSNLSR